MRTTRCSNIHLWKSKISIRVQRNHTFDGVTSVRTGTGSAQNIPIEGNKLGEHVLASVLRTSWASKSYYLCWAGSLRAGAAAAREYQELQLVHYQAPVRDNSLIVLCYMYLHLLPKWLFYPSFSSTFGSKYTYQNVPLWDLCTSYYCLSRGGMTSKYDFVTVASHNPRNFLACLGHPSACPHGAVHNYTAASTGVTCSSQRRPSP